VLANQCPHNLDLLCWIAGLPKRVTAHVSLGRYHDIEVEDDVQAFFEYEGGATGAFITSTGECPGTNYFEIAGDRGKLTCVADKSIELMLTDVSIAEFSRGSPGMWGAPATSRITIEPPTGTAHKGIWQNFVEAILDGSPLLAPGDDGLASVELSNAMILSGLTRKSVDLPLDYAAFDTLLRDLIAKSKKSNALPPGL
jgi:predicted dehydrogenase